MVRDNALLLSTGAQFNEPIAVSILQWLNDMHVIFGNDEERLWKQAIKSMDDENLRLRITNFAKYADLGIDSIVKQITVSLVPTGNMMMREKKPIV